MIEASMSHRNQATGDYPVHHLFNNLFFCRYGSGVVHIAQWATDVEWQTVHRFFNSGGETYLSKPIFEVRIPPEQWVSVIAEMSLPGKVNENHEVARRLHLG